MKLFLGNGDIYRLSLYAVYRHIIDDVYHIVDGSLDFSSVLGCGDIITVIDEVIDLASLFEVVGVSHDLVAVRKIF